MNFRPYAETDIDRVKQLLSKQPFEMELPSLADPRVVSKVAITNGTGEGIAFGFVRVIGEGYILLDKDWATPGWRWEALKLAHSKVMEGAMAQGLNKCCTWVPNEIVKSYAKRLESLGWSGQDRKSFVIEVADGWV